MGRLVLTYHMTRLEHWSREGADLLSLQADLALLAARGVPVLSLDALLAPGCTRGVAITFDDGTRMDAEAIVHPRLACRRRCPSCARPRRACRACRSRAS